MGGGLVKGGEGIKNVARGLADDSLANGEVFVNV